MYCSISYLQALCLNEPFPHILTPYIKTFVCLVSFSFGRVCLKHIKDNGLFYPQLFGKNIVLNQKTVLYFETKFESLKILFSARHLVEV